MKRIAILAVIFIASVGVGYFIISKPDPLPIINPADVNPELVDSALHNMDRHHRIGEFSLTNQLGNEVTEETTEGKIYVADFFFTRCKTICPVMSSNLEFVQNEFANDDDVLILSHSVTPEADTPAILLDYAYKHGAIDNKWHFLTGSKKEIYRLARQHYFVVLSEGDGGMQDFIHTENFVLIDEQNRIRGFYDGTLREEIDRLIDDIKNLQANRKQ